MTNSIKSLKKALEHLDTTDERIQKLIRLFTKLHPGLFNYQFTKGREHECGLFDSLSTEEIGTIEQGLAAGDSVDDARKICDGLREEMVYEGGNDPDFVGDD